MNTIKYEEIKVFFINKISIELANNTLSLDFDYKSKIMNLDNIKSIELYALGVWKGISWSLKRPSCPPLLESQEEKGIYLKLLKNCLQSGEQELEQINSQLVAQQGEVANWKNECQKLTNWDIKQLQEQLTTMANEKTQLEREKKELIAKLTNSIDKKDYENIR